MQFEGVVQLHLESSFDWLILRRHDILYISPLIVHGTIANVVDLDTLLVFLQHLHYIKACWGHAVSFQPWAFEEYKCPCILGSLSAKVVCHLDSQ